MTSFHSRMDEVSQHSFAVLEGRSVSTNPKTEDVLGGFNGIGVITDFYQVLPESRHGCPPQP